MVLFSSLRAKSAGKLYYDADGAGGAAAMQIATLANAPALDAGSIFILH